MTRQETGMDPDTRQALTVIRAAITVLNDKENQDRALVVEMADAMLADLLAGHDATMDHYIGRYCDVIDGPDDIAEILIEIDAQITEWENQ